MSKSSRALTKFIKAQPVAPVKSNAPPAPARGGDLRSTFGLNPSNTQNNSQAPVSGAKGLLSELREKVAEWDKIQPELEELRERAELSDELEEDLQSLKETIDQYAKDDTELRARAKAAEARLGNLQCALNLALGALLARSGDAEAVCTAIRTTLAQCA